MMQEKNKKRKQLLVLFFIAIVAVWATVYIGKPMIAFVSDAEAFRIWVEESGWWGRVAYVLMLLFQVVFAFIPGGVFEVAGGYAFGALEGTILSVIGTTMGSAAVFMLVKAFGLKVVLLFFSQEQLDGVKFMHESKRLDLIVLITFLIPGTPKDLLCYVAGLTDMKLSTWLTITSIARIPAITISTIGGNAIGTQRYTFAIGVLIFTLILSGIGILVYHYMTKHENEQ